MLRWFSIAVVGWATFQLGAWIAMRFRPRVECARASPVSSLRIFAALMILIAAAIFGAWNQNTKAYVVTYLDFGILAGCIALGYHSIRGRQKSLQDDINDLAKGVSQAYTRPTADEERLREILAVASRNDAISSKLTVGVLIEGPDGRPRGCVKRAANTLVDDRSFPSGITTSTEEKIDLLLEEIGFALLAKFGEDVMPKRYRQNLSPRDLRNIKESSARTRATLDDSCIDWASLNEAVFHISEARLRRGFQVADLTAMEQRVRAERGV